MKSIAVAVLLLAASPTFAMVKCRTADGRIVIGDKPPPGCVIESSYEDAAPRAAAAEPAAEAPSSGDAIKDEVFSVRTSKRRKDIERDMNAAAEDLAKTRRTIANVPTAPFTIYRDGFATLQHINDAEEFRNQRAAVLEELKKRERSDLISIGRLQDDLDTLDAQVTERFGTAPSWWRASVKCEGCPSDSEIAEARASR